MGVFNKADILFPAKGIELEKWSVVACDQYTSEAEYWYETEKIVGDAPSTYNLIYPEVFLGEGEKRIAKINAAMDNYLSKGVFEERKNCFVYAERTQSNGKVRRGIVGAVDLEEYSYEKGYSGKIRATEGTVLERIPPRVKIRENASMEFPHIMLLADDKKGNLIRPYKKGEKIYDFELMQNGGHLKGWILTEDEAEQVLSALDELDKNAQGNLLFAVGDGNHSLATAKACWEKVKSNLSDEEKLHHPARFCLAEIVNIYDEALEFEPIHRVIFESELEDVINELKKFYPETSSEDNGGLKTEYICADKRGTLYIKNSGCTLAVGAIQKFLDSAGWRVDYIHGEDSLKRLCAAGENVGFLFSAMKKESLFTAVISDGSLPRKTFSMGEAQDKRYYLEGKKIK